LFGNVVKWGFIGFNGLMLLFVFVVISSTGSVIDQAGGDAEKGGAAVGGILGIGLVMFIWFFGFVIGGVCLLLTRPQTPSVIVNLSEPLPPNQSKIAGQHFVSKSPRQSWKKYLEVATAEVWATTLVTQAFIVAVFKFVVSAIKAWRAPPEAKPKIQHWSSVLPLANKDRIRAGVGCFVLLLVVKGIGTSDSNDSKSATSSSSTANIASIPNSSSSDTPKPAPATEKSDEKVSGSDAGSNEYEMRREFQFGEYKYNIIGVERHSQIGQQPFGETAGPGATFVVVAYSIENCTKESQTVQSDDFTLVDSEGRSFSTSSKVATALAMAYQDNDFILSELQPGLPRKMRQGFELPIKSIGSGMTLVIPEKGWFTSGKAMVKVKF